MKKQFKTYRRTILGVFTAALAFTFVTLMGQMSLSAEDWSDEVKRQKIEDLYNGYKKQFPDVLDLSAQKFNEPYG